MQVSETMAHSNGFITASNGAYDDDDKPMLIIKKSIDSQANGGLTALINKQLQGEVRPRHGLDNAFLCYLCLSFWMWNDEKKENPLVEFFEFSSLIRIFPIFHFLFILNLVRKAWKLIFLLIFIFHFFSPRARKIFLL